MKNRRFRVLVERFRYWKRIARFHLQLLNARINRRSDNLPDVVCIGVPKAATTWLYVKLLEVDQVFLPKGKELHFFDERYQVNSASTYFSHEKKGLFWRYEFDLASDLDWQWYKNQFQNGENKIKLDITPTYCRVSLARIKQIKAFLPHAKVILIIRNPIDRVWSGASYFLDRLTGKQMDDLDIESELGPWVFDAERLDYSNYEEMIQNWDKVYDDTGQIMYVIYDDIVERPQETLSSICQFIGVDANQCPEIRPDEKRVNSSYKKQCIPNKIHAELVEIFRPQIRFLENRFGRDLSSWLK
jgi:hypothetical protein